jgi:AAA+ ATPase superfamily predicted ATPase
MSRFVGRERQLQTLDALLDRVARKDDPKPGKALLMRGRRRVGKSRLVEEFLSRATVPNVYFTASGRSTREELRFFAEEAAASTLPGAGLFDGVSLDSWDAALRLLSAALASDGPTVIVIDELPYLTVGDPAFEGTLQKMFDRELSGKPVLLIGIGSDLAMMEALNEYGRPFHQRATEMVVPPLAPSEVAAMLQLEPADAFDAYLVTGGLPLVLDEWPAGASLWDYLAEAVSSPTSALLVSGERALAAEFPGRTQARDVLTAIGSGERTFANIGRAAGNPPQASLSRALGLLRNKGVVALETPLSTLKATDSRYRVSDPYLRFWLSFLGDHLPEIERGRGDRVLARIRTQWTSWRGRAVEPILREALDRLPAGQRPAETGVVGSYWTRSNNPEIDVVVADRVPIAQTLLGVGSIKWLEAMAFDDHDFGELLVHRSLLPGADEHTPVFAVSRSGCSVPGLRVYEPEELLATW